MHTGETKNVLALTLALSLHIRMYQQSMFLTERHYIPECALWRIPSVPPVSADLRKLSV